MGFGNEQELSCISCTLLGHDINGDTSPGTAIVQLFNTSITCMTLSTFAEIYDEEAAQAPVSSSMLRFSFQQMHVRGLNIHLHLDSHRLTI